MEQYISKHEENELLVYRASVKRLCELMAIDENIDIELLYLNVLRDIGNIKDTKLLSLNARDSWTEIARIIKNNIRLVKYIDGFKTVTEILKELGEK